MPDRHRRPTSNGRDYREWLIEQGLLIPASVVKSRPPTRFFCVSLLLDAVGRASAARSIRLADGSDADLFRRPLGWLHVLGR